MTAPNNGPSDNAWGKVLTDQVLIKHQGRLILIARESGFPAGTLYFTVLDPPAASAGDDLSAWNGWYRYQFPEVAAAALPSTPQEAAAVPARELRLAGMDLLTVSPLAKTVAAADASFRVSSDGDFLIVFRQSNGGALLMNRLGLLARSEEEDRESVERFALEPAWEVRFRRSGLRDVPLDDVDGEAYLDPTGEPFYEPTIEFGRISGLAGGSYDVARIPTADPEISILYAAVATADGVQLHQVRISSTGLTDYTETPIVYPPIKPTLRSGGTALKPIDGLAPTLTFYAEHDMASTARGDQAELQRAGHLMLVIPVSGEGLTSAVAVYDFALDRDGNIPQLPASRQSLVVVDGTLSGGVFKPDTTAPYYPQPADIPATVQMVGGLLVSSMVLGQVQPKRSPTLYSGDDGLVHLYFAGPHPTPPFDRWSALDPNLPQALVAQFDARANRLVLSVPWKMDENQEQPDGKVEFHALQSGSIMDGAKIAVSSSTGPPGPGGSPAADLCDVSITYPVVSGLPAETWRGVPRSLGLFMDVLNGKASDDSADPSVLSGTKPFFDYSATWAQARLLLTLPGLSAGLPPVVTFVATMSDISLASVNVADAGANRQDYTLTFKDSAGKLLVLHWRSVPATIATDDGFQSGVTAFGDIFSGTAGAAIYPYPEDNGGTPLFGIVTDAVGIPAPIVLYSLGTNPDVANLVIAVTKSASAADACDVTFKGITPVVEIKNVPTEVTRFATTLQAAPEFKALGLGITASAAAGGVQPTPEKMPVRRMRLAETAALFDVLLPEQDLFGAAVAAKLYGAGFQEHVFEQCATLDPTRMVGFLVSSIRPSAGATAYVQNTAGGATRSLSRSLYLEADGNPLVSGVWIRTPAQQQCSFVGADSLAVPVIKDGRVIPHSTNLRPQWDWTLEAWIRPTAGQLRRVVTFRDDVTPVPSGAPSLAYAAAIDSQQVVKASAYNKTRGQRDSSYFETGTHATIKFMPSEAFTWEFWVKPDDSPAPPNAMGEIIQVGDKTKNAFLVAGVTGDRHVKIVTVDVNAKSHDHVSSATLPVRAWSHVAIVGKYDSNNKNWTLQLLVDAAVADTFANVSLQAQPAAVLVIGANDLYNATLFGSMAQLRYWSIARSVADIKITMLTSLHGFEPGLLGNWPLNEILTGTYEYVANTAAATSAAWNARLYRRSAQAIGLGPDSFFLSVVATVAGLPTVQANTLLANDYWNHLALVYQAGGALEMNPAQRYGVGRYDWVDCGAADGLGPTGPFAIDAYVRIPSGTQGEIGTIMARWANDEDPDAQSFQYWIDAKGEMNLGLWVFSDNQGTVKHITAKSGGANLADGKTHHVAVVFSSKRTGESDAEWTITFYKDDSPVGETHETIQGVSSIDIRNTAGNVTIGTAFKPLAGASPIAPESYAYFRGTLGKMRFWGTDTSVKALFPERYPTNPMAGKPKGLAASWAFREQSGRVAFDTIGSADGKLSNSAMWASLADTSSLAIIANGAPVGGIKPVETRLAVPKAQFTLGAPLDEPAVTGFAGDIAQVALYAEARSVEMIQDQMFVPRYGGEPGLIACWNFSAGGKDITGGQNNIEPQIPASRVKTSTAPLSNEGPYVRNVYGGVITDRSQPAPGRIAVGSYADAQNIGTVRQRGVLKRQYVCDPNQRPMRAIEIGPLDLTYIGQVQTDPTLIGYIEGAPPVPSENLTRPYYLTPGNPVYMDLATVSLVQDAADKLEFTSSSSEKTQFDFGAVFGPLLIDKNISIITLPFFAEEEIDLKGKVQAVGKFSWEYDRGSAEGINRSWGDTKRDRMSVKGDWEPYQADQRKYLNPVVGRRLLVNNSAYALVESLTADLYALTFGPTKVSVGTIILPNPAIPPDRNIIVFPMNDSYTKNGTLDGKVGLVNDPAYPDADIRRGSFFRPVEAYSLENRIKRQRERASSIAKQFDPQRMALALDTGLDKLRDTTSEVSENDSENPIALSGQGLVNRYVWTADGGFHAEEQQASISSSRAFSGSSTIGGGGGIHGEADAVMFGTGLAWSLDIMSTHRLSIQASKKATTDALLRLDVTVNGDAFLRTFDPDAEDDYGRKGAYLPGLSPGKVQTYRFMTFYLPPSAENRTQFSTIVDPTWLRLSNDSNARALRRLKTSSPWRVFHRVTYVERVPPAVASRPVFTPTTAIVAPVNVEGNAELVRMVDALIPEHTKERTRLIVGNAVAAAINPSPTAPDVYPQSAIEKWVPWWRIFLDRARPTVSSAPDPEAAKLLQAIVSRTTAYLFNGYASGAFDGLGIRPYQRNGFVVPAVPGSVNLRLAGHAPV